MIFSTSFDEAADAVYVQLADNPTAYSQEKSDHIIIDFSSDGSVVGIEFLEVSSGYFDKLLGPQQFGRDAIMREALLLA